MPIGVEPMPVPIDAASVAMLHRTGSLWHRYRCASHRSWLRCRADGIDAVSDQSSTVPVPIAARAWPCQTSSVRCRCGLAAAQLRNSTGRFSCFQQFRRSYLYRVPHKTIKNHQTGIWKQTILTKHRNIARVPQWITDDHSITTRFTWKLAITPILRNKFTRSETTCLSMPSSMHFPLIPNLQHAKSPAENSQSATKGRRRRNQ